MKLMYMQLSTSPIYQRTIIVTVNLLCKSLKSKICPDLPTLRAKLAP